jgi:hypothetical protein
MGRNIQAAKQVHMGHDVRSLQKNSHRAERGTMANNTLRFRTPKNVDNYKVIKIITLL